MLTSETVTRDILTHHLTAFGNNDLDGIMKDYTAESEVLTPEGPLKGLAAIRKFFEDFFIAIPTGSAFEMKQLTVTGNVAYIAWASESAVAKIPMGTDTFFLEGDKIRFHTVADYRLAE
ncbi:nuclear transport factor 2 family protein [Pontibacter diazotrophicus]|uniref:Nuclear transport factor 2 family protein n=1 Tax=Pontibacter diazotrophicus TaxID=1400979 RepID=A0A3D8LH16_9BACT|nr:nuclear transport factor 2 family protein [Pontibacter diazotrophicus]RDV16524.1 nuclear transport factor 2 family protein [Pontibacter diazotrophicus]